MGVQPCSSGTKKSGRASEFRKRKKLKREKMRVAGKRRKSNSRGYCSPPARLNCLEPRVKAACFSAVGPSRCSCCKRWGRVNAGLPIVWRVVVVAVVLLLVAADRTEPVCVSSSSFVFLRFLPLLFTRARSRALAAAAGSIATINSHPNSSSRVAACTGGGSSAAASLT